MLNDLNSWASKGSKGVSNGRICILVLSLSTTMDRMVVMGLMETRRMVGKTSGGVSD